MLKVLLHFTLFSGYSQEENHNFYLAAVLSLVINWNSSTARHKDKSTLLLILSDAAENFLQGHIQFFSVNNPQNSENWQLPLAWCWLRWVHVKEKPICALLVRDISAEDVFFFSLSAAVREYEEEREHLSLKLRRMPVSTEVIVLKVCIIV